MKKELEEKIAEQRSLEWAKRLEKEKQQQRELKELRGEESDEDDIDKIEAAIDEKEEIRGDSDGKVIFAIVYKFNQYCSAVASSCYRHAVAHINVNIRIN